jgi:hypothetical protein
MFKKIMIAIATVASITVSLQAHAQTVYNSVATAYVTTNISQSVVFDSTLQNGGTFTFSVLAHNGGGRAGQSDTANVSITFFDANGTQISTVSSNYSHNLPQPSQSGTANSQGTMLSGNPQADPAVAWTNLTVSSTNCGGSCANVSYAVVKMTGVDGSFWAGDYGPWYRAPTLTVNGGNNLVYNPEFGPYNGTNAQGWTISPALGSCQGAWGGSNACIVDSSGTPGQNTVGLVANQNGGGPSASGGSTSGTAGGYNNTMSVSNPGPGTTGGASAPTVISTAPGTPTVTNSTTNGTTTTTTTYSYGTPTVTQTHSDSSTKNGNMVTVTRTTTTTTSTPYTQTDTASTPYTITTVTTPTTVTTYSDGSTTTTNGTPVTTTTIGSTDVVTTTTGTNVSSSNSDAYNNVDVGGTQAVFDYNIVNPFIIDPLTTKDGSWVNASGSISGNVGASGLNFGYQKTVDDITAGVAGQAGQLVNSALNSTISGTNYSATAYLFKKTEPLWIKGSIGFNVVDVTTKNSISDFGLSYVQTAEQRISYGDLTLYSATVYAGWRPLIGATVVNSEIGSIVESGSSLLSNGLTNSKNTYVMPYVGTRYEMDEDVSFEGRVTNTDQYGAVLGIRSTVKKKVFDNTSIFLRGGYDQGNNYNNATVMVGLTIDF